MSRCKHLEVWVDTAWTSRALVKEGCAVVYATHRHPLRTGTHKVQCIACHLTHTVTTRSILRAPKWVRVAVHAALARPGETRG